MRAKDVVGRFGEEQAAAYLESAGLAILGRNWRCREGEIDIVARDGDQLVFVEVKTRSSSAFGLPAEAVDRTKSARIRLLGLRWIMAQRDAGQAQFWSSVRFDVVAILGAGDQARVDHIAGAF